MSQQASAFPGFPSSGEATAVPRLFFSQLLPSISRAEELIVTLYFFYAQGRAKGRPLRFLAAPELAAEAALIRALANFSDDTQAALQLGLALAVERGTLLRAEVESDGQAQAIYLLNTPGQRRALVRLSQVHLEEPLPPAQVEPDDNVLALLARLYQENIGSITPVLADELKDAAERYREHPQWIEWAFREAVKQNKRRWSYVQAILQRWEAEGPDYEAIGRDTTADGGRRDPQSRRPLSGRYRHLFRR